MAPPRWATAVPEWMNSVEGDASDSMSVTSEANSVASSSGSIPHTVAPSVSHSISTASQYHHSAAAAYKSSLSPFVTAPPSLPNVMAAMYPDSVTSVRTGEDMFDVRSFASGASGMESIQPATITPYTITRSSASAASYQHLQSFHHIPPLNFSNLTSTATPQHSAFQPHPAFHTSTFTTNSDHQPANFNYSAGFQNAANPNFLAQPQMNTSYIPHSASVPSAAVAPSYTPYHNIEMPSSAAVTPYTLTPYTISPVPGGAGQQPLHAVEQNPAEREPLLGVPLQFDTPEPHKAPPHYSAEAQSISLYTAFQRPSPRPKDAEPAIAYDVQPQRVDVQPQRINSGPTVRPMPMSARQEGRQHQKGRIRSNSVPAGKPKEQSRRSKHFRRHHHHSHMDDDNAAVLVAATTGLAAIGALGLMLTL